MDQRRPIAQTGRATQTRTRILRRAEELYYHGGYPGISLQELAARLGLTKAALFHHFRSKHDLFFAMLLAMLEDRRQRIEAAIATAAEPEGRLRAILFALADCPFFDPMKFLTDERNYLSLEQQHAVEVAFASAIRAPVTQVLADGVARGVLRPHRLVLGTTVFLNLALLLPSPGHPQHSPTDQADRASYIEELLTFFLQGIGSPDSAS